MRSQTASMGCRTLALHRLQGEGGQATLEFALILFAFLSLLVGLGALADFARSGALVEHAGATASHTLGSDAGAVADVLAY